MVRLTVDGFRGSSQKIYLDCTENQNSIVLFGNNGDGKTTFSDAIEWFFTDKIHYLEREGCGKDDFFNAYIDEKNDAYVEINLNDSKLDAIKTLRRKKSSTFSNNTTDFSNYIKASEKESLILRHHTMREFVDMRKKDKLEKLEEIIGLEIVKDIRAVLLKATNSLSKDATYLALLGQIKERKTDIIAVLDKENFIMEDVISFTDSKVKECDNSLTVKTIADLKAVVEKLDKKVAGNTSGSKLLVLNEVSEKMKSLTSLKESFDETDKIVTSHNILVKESKIIEASAKEKLYNAAIEALENKNVKPGECPVCKRPINTQELLVTLRSEVNELEGILKKRKDILLSIRELQNKILPIQVKFHRLLELKKAKDPSISIELGKALENINPQLTMHNEALNKMLTHIDSISMSPIKDLDDVKEITEKTQLNIEEMKKSLELTDEEKRFYENVNQIKNLYNNYIRYEELSSTVKKYDNQISSMRKIYDSFEKLETESIKKVLNVISQDVSEYFLFLHPDDNIEKIELVTTEERGIEFKLKRHGIEITPPMKILSEAHLNSLGICLFLASSKYFNKVNEFLILDDVVTSFDMGHRRILSRLFVEKFPDIQFLLLTHDELWFEMLKTDLSGNNWIFKELVKWDKDKGIDIKDSPINLRERITDNLKQNDAKGAATKCRMLIEEILKEKCENLGIKGLEFRIGESNDRRDPNELVAALTSYINDNKALRDKESKKIFEHLKASQLIENMGAHHRKLDSTVLHRGDVELALRDIDVFEALFICDKCKTEPQKKYSPSFSKLKNCKCGDFKI